VLVDMCLASAIAAYAAIAKSNPKNIYSEVSTKELPLMSPGSSKKFSSATQSLLVVPLM